MAGRGRVSVAELSVVGGGVISTIRRPEPPSELTDEQAAEWRAVVTRLPAEWFQRETHGLLAQYCRHVVAARRVAQLIQSHEEGEHANFSVEDYDRLLKMQEREGRAMSSLATRMRISQHATYDKTKKKPIEAERPWKP